MRDEGHRTPGGVFRPWGLRAILFLVCFTCVACWRSAPPPAPPPSAPPAPPSAPGTVVASMHALDLDGKPVPGVIPIATREANAFDKPIVQGEPTKADGSSSVTIPTNERLFLRMWDPAVKCFANNFFEIQPGGKLEAQAMDVVMVPGASLDMTVAAMNATVDILLHHPTQGPWWPARATSDASGRVHFEAVPAGIFSMRVKTSSGQTAELPEVRLEPGGHTELGEVALN